MRPGRTGGAVDPGILGSLARGQGIPISSCPFTGNEDAEVEWKSAWRDLDERLRDDARRHALESVLADLWRGHKGHAPRRADAWGEARRLLAETMHDVLLEQEGL